MKRSRAVQAFLVVSAASALNSCGQRHEAVRRCVDENGSFTDNRNCTSPVAGAAHHYAWVYAPAGASNSSASGNTSVAGEATSRGVVGAEGAAHAGGEGGAHAGGGGGE